MNDQETAQPKELIRFLVAGLQHSDYKSLTDRIVEGSPVSVIPEPDNQYDPYALRLEIENTKIGYVPKQINQWVAKQFLLHDGNIAATVTKYDTSKVIHRSLEVALYAYPQRDN